MKRFSISILMMFVFALFSYANIVPFGYDSSDCQTCPQMSEEELQWYIESYTPHTFRSNLSIPDSFKDISYPSKSALSNKGTDFWLLFMRNYEGGTSGSPVTLFIDITSDEYTTGTISMPGFDWEEEFTVIANEITRIIVPTGQAQIMGHNTIEERGIRIVSEKDITVYGTNQRDYSSDSFLGLPVSILGTQYLTISYNSSASELNASQFAIVSPYDSNMVTITPSQQTRAGQPAGVPFSITLNKGQSFLVRGAGNQNDLTGSIIESTMPVAVFSGSAATNVPSGITAADHLVQQVPPILAWGESFVTHPLEGRANGDTWRFLASQNNTELIINGETVDILNFGDFHETILTISSYVQADKPILAVQFANGQSWDGLLGDPFMMIVPPYEQFLSSYTFATPSQGFVHNFFNVTVHNDGINSMLLDGELLETEAFFAIEGSDFSAVGFPISINTTYNITNIDGHPFGLYVYGFNDYDSYGYPGGLSLATIHEGSAPNIELLDSTIEYFCTSVSSDISIDITALITDDIEPFVTSAAIFYRIIGHGVDEYTNVPMEHIGNDIWVGTINSENTGFPGIEFFITATDGLQTTTSPAINPYHNPYSISIDNAPPELNFTPVTASPVGEDIIIQGYVYDSTDYVESVKLYYRIIGGTPLYAEVNMALIDGDIHDGTYRGIIPGHHMTEHGIEYYINATDNYGASCSFGLPDMPFSIEPIIIPFDIIFIGRTKVGYINPQGGEADVYVYYLNPYGDERGDLSSAINVVGDNREYYKGSTFMATSNFFAVGDYISATVLHFEFPPNPFSYGQIFDYNILIGGKAPRHYQFFQYDNQLSESNNQIIDFIQGIIQEYFLAGFQFTKPDRSFRDQLEYGIYYNRFRGMFLAELAVIEYRMTEAEHLHDTVNMGIDFIALVANLHSIAKNTHKFVNTTKYTGVATDFLSADAWIKWANTVNLIEDLSVKTTKAIMSTNAFAFDYGEFGQELVLTLATCTAAYFVPFFAANCLKMTVTTLAKWMNWLSFDQQIRKLQQEKRLIEFRREFLDFYYFYNKDHELIIEGMGISRDEYDALKSEIKDALKDYNLGLNELDFLMAAYHNLRHYNLDPYVQRYGYGDVFAQGLIQPWVPIPHFYHFKKNQETINAITVFAQDQISSYYPQMSEKVLYTGKGGMISGQINDKDGFPVQYAFVIAYPDGGSEPYVAITDANGNYTLTNLVPDNYIIFFDSGDPSHTSLFYPDVQSITDAIPVTVSDGGSYSIDSQLSIGYSISGNVMSVDNMPLSDIKVTAYNIDTLRVYEAITDVDGYYAIFSLPNGEYEVKFSAVSSSEYLAQWYGYPDLPASITVNNEDMGGINAYLATGSKIIGGIINNSGLPVTGFQVFLLDEYGSGLHKTTYTDDEGLYRFKGLDAGNYTILFLSQDSLYIKEWYNQSKDNINAAIIVLDENDVYYADQTILSEGGGISGTVLDIDNNPIRLSSVIAYSSDNQLDYYTGLTNESGEYKIYGIPEGNYKIFFGSGTSMYQSSWYNNADNWNNATEYTISAGLIITDINGILSEQGGTISGTVTAPDSLPISDIIVQAYNIDTGNVYTALTDSFGAYEIVVLKTGYYKIKFDPYGSSDNNQYLQQWYNDQDYEDADILQVYSGQNINNINVQLKIGATLSGMVTGENGSPLGSVLVELWRPATGEDSGISKSHQSFTNELGEYSMAGILPGTYKLLIMPTGPNQTYTAQWYNNHYLLEDADEIATVYGQHQVLDIILEQGSTISGNIESSTGEAIKNVYVSVFDEDNNFIFGGHSDIDGDFAIHGLPSGTYRLFFDTSAFLLSYESKWYDDAESFEDATPIIIEFPSHISGINATLADSICDEPNVTTLDAITITHNSATIRGQGNANGCHAYVWFEWGTSIEYNRTTPMQVLEENRDYHIYSFDLGFLTSNTTYYYRAVIQSAVGMAYGEGFSFTTSTSQKRNLYLLAYPDDIGVVLTGAGEHFVDSEVEISASLNKAYQFVEWTGVPEDIALLADSSSALTTFIMPDRDIEFTAVYHNFNELTLFAEPDDIGIVLTGAGEYSEGSDVQISADLVKGYVFAGWTGEHIHLLEDPYSESTSFVMPGHDLSFTAVCDMPTSAIISIEAPFAMGIWKWDYIGDKFDFCDIDDSQQGLGKDKSGTWRNLISGFIAQKIIVEDITGNGNLDIIMNIADIGLGYYDLISSTWTGISGDCSVFTVAKVKIDPPKQIVASKQGGVFVFDLFESNWVKIADLHADVLIASNLHKNNPLDDLLVGFRGIDSFMIYSFETQKFNTLLNIKPSQVLSGDITGDGNNELVCSFDEHGVYLLKFANDKLSIDTDGNIDLLKKVPQNNEWVSINKNLSIQRLTYAVPDADHLMAVADIDYCDAMELILAIGGRTYYYSYTEYVENDQGWKTLVNAPMKRIISGRFTGYIKDDIIACDSIDNNIYLRNSHTSSWHLLAREVNTNAMSPYDHGRVAQQAIYADLDINSWYSWVPNTGQWSITEGPFVVTRMDHDTSTAYYHKNFSNFEFEVELMKSAGGFCGLGIIFNGDPSEINDIGDWKRFYHLYYCASGTWNLALRYGNNLEFLQEWKFSPDINTGIGVWNKLKVVVANGFIDVYINDILQGTYFDDTFVSGKIGLKMYNRYFTGTAEFKNLSFSRLNRAYTFGRVNQYPIRNIYYGEGLNCNECDEMELVGTREIQIPSYGNKNIFIPSTGY